MRIVVNGWFVDQLTTGSGQYLNALAEWLPRVAAGHEFIIVGSANRRISESANDASLNTQSPVPNPQVHTPFDHISPNLAKLWFEQMTFPRACRRLAADVAFVPVLGLTVVAALPGRCHHP